MGPQSSSGFSSQLRAAGAAWVPYPVLSAVLGAALLSLISAWYFRPSEEESPGTKFTGDHENDSRLNEARAALSRQESAARW
jgi:hypothetical protein